MKTIQIEIEDSKFDDFMIIIKNLKANLIKKLVVNEKIDYVDKQEQLYYEKLIDNLSDEDREVSSKVIALVNDIDFRGDVYK
jgi:hypothetical protein